MAESRTITASPIHGRNTTPTTIIETSRTTIPIGTDRSKYTTTGLIGDRRISVVVRGIQGNEMSTWLFFQKIGLPVVPTLRVNNETNELISTDLKADGSEIYGRGFKMEIYGNKNFLINRDSRLRQIDDAFLDVTSPDNLETIEKQIRIYEDIANSNNVTLPWNDPFELVIHPDGSWNLIILDLHTASIGHPTGTRSIPDLNREFSQQFLVNLQQIRRQLISHYTNY